MNRFIRIDIGEQGIYQNIDVIYFILLNLQITLFLIL